ncbi:hypothetical protein [Chryseobacterium gambrini]|uniref:hypothetical protein n=1 Tax=Chryseobacterium gambrini TaxID=373672 RepID=UPI003D0E318B
MTLSFEELKFLIIDKQRKIEINKLFHLYVKAENYGDILRIIKSESNFKWILQNGFRELIPYFPNEELEKENIYTSEVELADQNSDVILLSGAILNLNQSGKNRCRVIVDGGNATITVNDMAMVEVETYGRGSVNIYNNGWGYAYLISRNNSQIELHGNDNSTFYLEAYQESNISAYLQPKSYIYYKLFDNAILNSNTENIYGKQNDKSKINT